MKKLEADVIIVGSGIAGALCAWKLAKKGIKVLVLEAGPRISREKVVAGFKGTHKLDYSSGYPNEKWAPRPDWGPAEGDGYINQTGTAVARMEYLRVVGGTTWHWSANSIRLLPVEFRMKSAYGVGQDWPFGYDDLELYYEEAELEMGVAGDAAQSDGTPRRKPYPLPAIPMSYLEKTIIGELEEKSELRFVPRAAARNSRPSDGRPQCQGFGTCSPICPSAAQYAAIYHIEKAEKLGARVMENMLVDRVVKNASGKVTGVEGRTADGAKFTASGKAVVLAANGIETPKILLMSRDESTPKGLANSSGQVGRNFMDHPGIYCRFMMPKPVYPGRGPESVMASFTKRDGAFRKERSSWVMAMYNRMHLHDITHELLVSGMASPDLDGELKDRSQRQVELDVALEQMPDEKNGITLDTVKKDSAGQPVMNLHYSYSDYENKSFDLAREEFARVVALLGGKTIAVSEPFVHHHLMGMTRMGTNAKTSVTDGEGRAHDHRELFVISSSLFPTGGTANPTLTIAALALRTAEKVAAQVKKGG